MPDKPKKSLKQRITTLYEGMTPDSHRFRYALLVFDVVTIAFVVVSSFVQTRSTEIIDAVIGVLIALDFFARLWISGNRRKMLMSPFGVIDMIVIAPHTFLPARIPSIIRLRDSS